MPLLVRRRGGRRVGRGLRGARARDGDAGFGPGPVRAHAGGRRAEGRRRLSSRAERRRRLPALPGRAQRHRLGRRHRHDASRAAAPLPHPLHQRRRRVRRERRRALLVRVRPPRRGLLRAAAARVPARLPLRERRTAEARARAGDADRAARVAECDRRVPRRRAPGRRGLSRLHARRPSSAVQAALSEALRVVSAISTPCALTGLRTLSRDERSEQEK
mmetsp:Transcript_37446/g.124056  ORF Transcript_37446/g.124056 Transcript_37446/m.124056 type:complete len:218 (-) Transcript_37446:42-695(-)